MAIIFQDAKREKIYTKVLLAGPSGSGKTYTALRLASGLAEKYGNEFVAMDSEAGRMLYYANEFRFKYVPIEAPFSPEKYIEIIQAVQDAGFKVLIIDSISHEWDYCLDVHGKMPGNSYTNWGRVTPRHDALMETILQCPLHIIVTVRGKDEYVLQEKDGKQIPQKVGLGYKQRDNIEYNYTTTFNLAQETHIASAMKDNTHLFEGRYEVLTERDGKALYAWANDGDTPKPKPKSEITPEGNIEALFTSIGSAIAKRLEAGTDRGEVSALIKSVCGTPNYKKITDAAIAANVLKAIDDMEENA